MQLIESSSRGQKRRVGRKGRITSSTIYERRRTVEVIEGTGGGRGRNKFVLGGGVIKEQRISAS